MSHEGETTNHELGTATLGKPEAASQQAVGLGL